MADDKKGINALATGVAGAVIGAAATAAAIALSDEKNRKKAEKVLSDMQLEGNRIFKEISKMALELRDRSLKALPEVKKSPKKKAAKRKSSINK